MKNILLALLLTALAGCVSVDGNRAPALPIIGLNLPRTIINGVVVDPADYPAVVWLGHCTATVVGPRTILTAAHCTKSDNKLQFKIGSESYSAVTTRSGLYATKDHDLALGYVDREMSIKPRTIQIKKDAREFERILMLGYGCTEIGGTGGNDGKLRTGYAQVSPPFSENYNLILKPLGDQEQTVCFGDSGGPNFRDDGTLIAVHSRGNIVDTAFPLRTDVPDSEAFLRNWSEANSTKICGVNLNCLDDCGETEPELPTEKQFHFVNDLIEIQGIIKN